MPDDSRAKALAARYLDLWARQVAGATSDPLAADALEFWIKTLNAGTHGAQTAGPAATDTDECSSAGGDHADGGEPGRPVDAAAPVAAAPGGGDDELDRRLRRLAGRARRDLAVDP